MGSVVSIEVAPPAEIGASFPAILANTPALKDFRENCKGIVYINPDRDEITKAILKLSELSVGARREIGLQLSKDVHVWYGVEIGASRYVDLYLERS